MPRFYEVFRCVGVDEEADPPAVLLGFGKTVVVALADGAGFSVKPRDASGNVVVTEILDPRMLITARNDFHNALMQPGVDAKLREGLTPDLVISVRGPTRYFNVSGKGLVGPPATFVAAKSGGTSNKGDATLQVVVVKKKAIKLAIRNLKVSDGGSGLVNHAKSPGVPEKDVANMNAVWTPQANIVFDLVSTDPLIIDERSPDTQTELAKALGVKPGTVALMDKAFKPHQLSEVIAARNHTSADFTFIVAGKAINADNDVVNGTTVPSGAFAVVTDERDLTTMAHEAGHFIGGHASKNGWVDQHHLQMKTDDTRFLMRGGGAGWKIPFEFAMRCRGFPTRP